MELNVNYDRAKMVQMEEDAKDERTSFRFYESYDPIGAEITPNVYAVEILQATVKRYADKSEAGAFNEQLELVVLFKNGGAGIKGRYHRFTIWGAHIHADGHSDLNPVRLQDFLVLCSRANPKFAKHYHKTFKKKDGTEVRQVYPEIAKLVFQVVATYSGKNAKGYDQYFAEFFSEKGLSAVELESAVDKPQDIKNCLKKAQKVYNEALEEQGKTSSGSFGGTQEQPQMQVQEQPKAPTVEPQIKSADDDIPF